MQLDPVGVAMAAGDAPISIEASAVVFAVGVYLIAPRRWHDLARLVKARVLGRPVE